MLIHPPEVVTVYVITELPARMPDINPVDTSIVATPGVALLQVPPVVVLVHVVMNPQHKGVVPEIV